LLGLFVGGNMIIFNLLFVFLCLFLCLRAALSASQIQYKLLLCAAYLFIMIVQIVFNVQVTFNPERLLVTRLAGRLLNLLFIGVPFMADTLVSRRGLPECCFPSAEEISTLSFEELKRNAAKIAAAAGAAGRAGKILSKENLDEIMRDLPRHNAFEYINNGSLTAAYFDAASNSLDDPNIYIVISSTGSAASELISLFTRKQYNHASLSFDAELKTIISYNGGERAYPPGLNHEAVEFFNKKKDASFLVYAVDAAPEQKRRIIDKVKEINDDGSAYNLMGLVLKFSPRPNIMFCSQFVYRMLDLAGLAYFKKRPGEVKPTDLVEMDYYRKLRFVCEIRLN
jgi:hypothetical protein